MYKGYVIGTNSVEKLAAQFLRSKQFMYYSTQLYRNAYTCKAIYPACPIAVVAHVYIRRMCAGSLMYAPPYTQHYGIAHNKAIPAINYPALTRVKQSTYARVARALQAAQQ